MQWGCTLIYRPLSYTFNHKIISVFLLFREDNGLSNKMNRISKLFHDKNLSERLNSLLILLEDRESNLKYLF